MWVVARVYGHVQRCENSVTNSSIVAATQSNHLSQGAGSSAFFAAQMRSGAPYRCSQVLPCSPSLMPRVSLGLEVCATLGDLHQHFAVLILGDDTMREQIVVVVAKQKLFCYQTLGGNVRACLHCNTPFIQYFSTAFWSTIQPNCACFSKKAERSP